VANSRLDVSRNGGRREQCSSGRHLACSDELESACFTIHEFFRKDAVRQAVLLGLALLIIDQYRAEFWEGRIQHRCRRGLSFLEYLDSNPASLA